MLMDQPPAAESAPCDPAWSPERRRAEGWNAVARLSAGRIEAFDLPVPGFPVWQWVCLALLPVAAALVARFAARLTVLRTLAKMA